MTRTQRVALKARVRSNLKFQKKELQKLASVGSRMHIKRAGLFKAAWSNIRKEIRLFQRLNSRLK